MKNYIITNHGIITDKDMGVNFYIITNFYFVANVRECTAVNIFANDTILSNKAWLFNASFLKTNEFMIFLKKFCEA